MPPHPIPDLTRFEAALRRFDEENARDPNREQGRGTSRPRELVYSEWLTEWVLRLFPRASEELRLAARGQHLCRWMIPRTDYPMTRAGYLQWRQILKELHAQKAGGILREAGYSEGVITRVQSLIRKEPFPQDPESQVLEDALCLVFLEHQFEPLARQTPADKMIGILRKTWKKMSPNAHSLALQLNYSPEAKDLLNRALGPDHN
jgi:hypothetical protein